ncbi:MAG TPA: hypothetical protein VFT75_12210 [Nocardioidaceae bacterium]|jgi:hypothetical protein|nr:hypothetical protein [Nocardioidaceae bacterium]
MSTLGALVLVIIVISATSSNGSTSSNTEDTSATGSSTTSSDTGVTDTADTTSQQSSDTTDTTSQNSSDTAEAPARVKAVKVKAKTILKEFEDNEAAADTKYKGKTLRVTGVVAKVDTELFDDSQYIIELNGGGRWEILTVNCNDVSESVAAKAEKGSTVSVVGQFDDGGDLGVELKDCTLAH